MLFYAVIILGAKLGEEENKQLFYLLVFPTFFDATLLYI